MHSKALDPHALLCGWKDIARYVQKKLGVPVSEYTAFRYSRALRDPLPVQTIYPGGVRRGRVIAYPDEVAEWCDRTHTAARSVQ